MKIKATKTVNKKTLLSILKALLFDLKRYSMGTVVDVMKQVSTCGISNNMENFTFGGSWTVKKTGETWLLHTITCGGNMHQLIINTQLKTLEIIHFGKRTSTPGLMPEDLPTIFNIDGLWDSKGWQLLEYKTSEPDWAPIAGLLKGKFGQDHKPGDKWEAEEMEAAKMRKTLSLVSQICELPIPEKKKEWYYSSLDEVKEIFSEIKKNLNTIHLCRLSANGITL